MTMTAPQAHTARDQQQSSPRQPRADRRVSMTLAATELSRFASQLDSLETAAWSRPTDCVAWDVRALSSHVLGMTQMFSSYVGMARQHLPAMRAAKHGPTYIDALTARQVADRADLTSEQITRGIHEAAPKMVRWRQKTPGLMRDRAMPDEQQVSSAPDGPTELWTFGYLFDTILTRDTWMHRIDIARATDRPLELTTEHDGLIVADVVSEWQDRHDQSFTLTLTGPVGGTWRRGVGGEQIAMDAVEFCRALSGRAEGPGLLAVAVPF